MRLWVVMFAAFLFVAPAFGQDDDGPGDGPPGGGGGGQTQVFTRVDNLDPMDQVKTFLGKANIKLSSDQKQALRRDNKVTLKQSRGATERLRPQGAGGTPAGRRGQRGAGPSGAGPNNPLITELRKINDDLVEKINA